MPSALLLDHFQSPRNVGELPSPAVKIEVTNPVCGDILRLTIAVESDRVAQVAFKARGCVASIATGSALTELLLGRTRQQLTAIDTAAIKEAVGGLEPASEHAAQLCIDALRIFLVNWR